MVKKRPNFQRYHRYNLDDELYRLVVVGGIQYVTINNFHNFDNDSLGKLSSAIFVTIRRFNDNIQHATEVTRNQQEVTGDNKQQTPPPQVAVFDFKHCDMMMVGMM